MVMIGLQSLRFAGYTNAVAVAIVLCTSLAVVDLILRRWDVRAMSVQIRLGYVLLLALGLIPGLEWIHVVQIVGTSIRVMTGYCLLERELRMLPWNQSGGTSWSQMCNILLACPGAGGILRFGGSLAPSPCDFQRVATVTPV
jgi:hypothetical protein